MIQSASQPTGGWTLVQTQPHSQGPLSFSPSGPWGRGSFRLFCSCDVTVTFGYVTCGHGHIVDSSYQIVLTDITYKINFLP